MFVNFEFNERDNKLINWEGSSPPNLYLLENVSAAWLAGWKFFW